MTVNALATIGATAGHDHPQTLQPHAMTVKQPQLGMRLKRVRILLELPLSGVKGVSKGQMHKIEAGGDLQLSTLNKILGAYGMRLSVRE